MANVKKKGSWSLQAQNPLFLRNFSLAQAGLGENTDRK
jgi:hypothetical protein